MIAITGANGQLGRLVINALLEQTSASNIVAIVRSPETCADIKALGIELRKADYNSPETLTPALQGIDNLLLISGSEIGQRVEQHKAVIDAAVSAQVSHLAYTSILKADNSPLILAQEHLATEKLIKASGLNSTILRNGWYSENYTANSQGALQAGSMCSPAGNGLLHSAARADYALAAATVLLNPNAHQGKVYELAGSNGYTLQAYSQMLAQAADKSVQYSDIDQASYTAFLIQIGLPEGFAAVLADAEAGIKNGWLANDNGTLAQLIGRPTTTIETSIKEVFAK